MTFLAVIKPGSFSYIPQTCITSTTKDGIGMPVYHFLDIFNSINRERCQRLPACNCQKSSSTEFHTECGKSSTNLFSTIPSEKIFQGTTHLTFVNGALPVIPDYSFSHLTQLIYLDLSYDIISVLSSHSFHNLKNLQVLLLHDNTLLCNEPDVAFPINVFKPFAKTLRVLDISYQPLKYQGIMCPTQNLPEEALSVLSELEEIAVPFGKTIPMGEGFSNMTKLKALNINMPIPSQDLPEDIFQNISALEIEVVCMVGQTVTNIGNQFSRLQHLKMLDLSGNDNLFTRGNSNLQTFFSTLPGTLTHLYLNNTGMPKILSFTDIVQRQLDKLEVLTIDENCIQWIDVSATNQNHLQHFSLRLNRGGFLKANYQLLVGIFNMRTLISADLSFQAPISPSELPVIGFTDDTMWDCISRVLTRFNPYINCTCFNSQSFCNISLPPNLESLQLSNNPSMKMQLVGSLMWTSNSSLSIVNMSSTNTHYLPIPIKCAENITISIQTIDLSLNSMGCIHSNYFKMCHWTSLKHLYLSQNNLGIYTIRCMDKEHAPLSFLKPLAKLEFLDLGHNNLVAFEFPMDISGGSLELLDISQNMLSSLSKETTSQLDEANSWRLENNRSAISLDISDNQLLCACENIDFYLWLHNTMVHLTDDSNFKCRYGSQEFNVSRAGLSNVLMNFDTICHLFQQVWVPIILTIVTYGIITLSAILYRLRHTIHYLWIKMRMHRHKMEAILNPDHQYHGFVSCDRTGAIWAKHNLLPKLEAKGTLSFL